MGANDEWRNIDVARRILKILGKKRDLIKFVPDRLSHDRRDALNCRKLRSLDWKTEMEFNDGLERTVTWYVENEDWWRKIKERSRISSRSTTRITKAGNNPRPPFRLEKAGVSLF